MAPAKQTGSTSTRRYGLLYVLAVIALMTAIGAALGVFAAHVGH